MYILTLILSKLRFTVYKKINEPIQQHTAVRYNCWLGSTAMKLGPQQTVNQYYTLPSTAKYILSFVAANCDEVGRTCGSYGGEKRGTQCVGGKT
jgi:hypothetical protein